MKSLCLLFILNLCLLSCGNGDTYEAANNRMAQGVEMAMDDVAEEEFTAADPLAEPVLVEKKIIKEGRMGVRVDELEPSRKRVDSLLAVYDGYYAKETLHNSTYESSLYLKIRIPVRHYERFISEVESGKGKVLYKEIDARDVTEQFLDLETRLANKRNYLSRYQDLVKQAKTVKEILEIEEQIRGLEEEIESTEGRLKYLSSQVSYSTLDLTFSKENEYKFIPGKRENFFERLKESFSSGWSTFVDFVLFLIGIWPFWFVIAGLVYLWRWLRKRWKAPK
ncbi:MULTISPECIES: DUF4349 domain-containing protein [unclassified Parabacteroides]|uniref:DUF4349 domain-containing protein n=2 Tax=unclassified Parabacteroides TaxID=2649774 RepID=UPI00247676F6|nr:MULTISPECIES: DUF4349 domain-containing protein [unclassified Parabacteroides]